MGIGISIFLLAVGAILAFAVHVSVHGVDLQTVGVILMAVGALGIVLFLLVFMPRRRRYVRETAYAPDEAAGGEPRARTRSDSVISDEVDRPY